MPVRTEEITSFLFYVLSESVQYFIFKNQLDSLRYDSLLTHASEDVNKVGYKYAIDSCLSLYLEIRFCVGPIVLFRGISTPRLKVLHRQTSNRSVAPNNAGGPLLQTRSQPSFKFEFRSGGASSLLFAEHLRKGVARDDPVRRRPSPLTTLALPGRQADDR